jgi:hypothetical protein
MSDDDAADAALLLLANDKGKFALELGLTLQPTEQYAFERGIDGRWFDLVDVAEIAEMPGRLMRVFRLTDAGSARLHELRGRQT